MKIAVYLTCLIVAATLLLTVPTEAQIVRVEVAVDGMACPFCAYGIEKRLKRVDGVDSVVIHLNAGLAKVTAAEASGLDLREIRKAIEKAGFTPGRLEAEAFGTVVSTEEESGWLLRFSGGEGQLPLNLVDEATARKLATLAANGRQVVVRGAVDWRPGNPALAVEGIEEVQE
jgi:mercuric ion binding protein